MGPEREEIFNVMPGWSETNPLLGTVETADIVKFILVFAAIG